MPQFRITTLETWEHRVRYTVDAPTLAEAYAQIQGQQHSYDREEIVESGDKVLFMLEVGDGQGEVPVPPEFQEKAAVKPEFSVLTLERASSDGCPEVLIVPAQAGDVDAFAFAVSEGYEMEEDDVATLHGPFTWSAPANAPMVTRCAICGSLSESGNERDDQDEFVGESRICGSCSHNYSPEEVAERLDVDPAVVYEAMGLEPPRE